MAQNRLKTSLAKSKLNHENLYLHLVLNFFLNHEKQSKEAFKSLAVFKIVLNNKKGEKSF